MICCVSVGLEVHIGHEHSSNSLFINAVSLGLSQTKAFPVEVGVLMSGSLKPYFYFVSRERTETVMLKQILESIPVIWDREHVRQHLAVQTLSLATSISTQIMMRPPERKMVILSSTDTLPCNLVPLKPSGGIKLINNSAKGCGRSLS